MLVELCPAGDHSELDIKRLRDRLAIIIGQWSAEQDRLDIAPLVKTFRAMRRDLERIAEILRAHEEGIQETHDFEVVSHLASVLALNPEVGSPQQAHKVIDSFRREAVNVAHACLITAHKLKQPVRQDGRPRSDWHDDFTALLLEIAEAAGVPPRFSKDRISGERVGWLVEAAQALETFLDPQMRAPSKEACGKRLERSLKFLKQRHRQNHTSG